MVNVKFKHTDTYKLDIYEYALEVKFVYGKFNMKFIFLMTMKLTLWQVKTV